MSISTKKIASKCGSRARGVQHHVNRVEILYEKDLLTLTDIHRIYSGAFIQYYTFLEKMIEKLFVGLLMGEYSSTSSNVNALISIKSYKVAHDVIKGGRKYVDWLPINITCKRAEAFFSSGRPFSTLEGRDKNVLNQLTTLRNAIAHKSSASQKSFLNVYVQGRSLPPEQLRPSGYLRGTHRIGQTRLEFLMSDSLRVMNILCS